MVTQPTFTWSVVGGGLIDSSGNYQPPYTTGSAIVPTGSAIVLATSGGVTGQTTTTYPGVAQWNSAGSGSWAGGSWIGTTSAAAVSPPGLRTVTGDYAQFATSGGTISLGSVTPVLAGLSFASSSSYTLSGGAMKLSNGANPATIVVSNGNHTIATPLTLQSNLSVTVLAGDSLTIGGGLSGSGESLAMNGPGKLVLQGSNSFSGGTTVLSGTLVVASPNALRDGSSLIVGASAGSFLAVIAAATAISPTTNAVASVAASATGGQSAAAGGGRPPLSSPASFAASPVSAAADGRSGTAPISPDSGTSRAALDAAIAAVARHSAADATWLECLQSAMASAGQQDRRTAAQRALDAALAAYSQQ
jgi:autotransporter-associated beta strand protein